MKGKTLIGHEQRYAWFEEILLLQWRELKIHLRRRINGREI